MKKKYSVLVVWEDASTREAAERFWEDMSSRFCAECDLQSSWVEQRELSRPTERRKATKHVAEADVLVFSLKGQPMPQALLVWLEAALSKRKEKEGYLALLSSARHCRNELMLRNLAHGAGMDFITELPPTIESSLPEYPEHYSRRAQEQSALLAEILRPPRSASWSRL